MTTDTLGNTSNNYSEGINAVIAYQITASASGVLQTVGLNLQTAAGDLATAIYTDVLGQPGVLLGNSAGSVAVLGWNDLSIPGSIPIVAGTKYWIAFNTTDGALSMYGSAGPVTQWYVSAAFGSWSVPNAYVNGYPAENMRMIYAALGGKSVINVMA